MAKQEFSISKLSERLRTEADAYLMLEELRWGGAPTACPKCGGMGRCSYIAPANGVSRKTRTGRESERRVWFCGHCRKQFTVLVNTIFHGTRISIRTWLFVLFEFAASKNSISAWEISRKYEITNESAWHMIHRIREATKREPAAALLRGTIVSDESWFGGDNKNRHDDKRNPDIGAGKTDKQPILALVDYETREVRSRIIPNAQRDTLNDAITEQVDVEHSQLWTDEYGSYRTIGKQFNSHHTVNHKAGEYKRNGAGTNLAEGYFSRVKRSLDGTHLHVTVEHLPRYLSQFDWLYSHCRETDSQRMRHLIGNVDGRRLTMQALVSGA